MLERNVESLPIVTRSAQMHGNERDGNFLDEEAAANGNARTNPARERERERETEIIAGSTTIPRKRKTLPCDR